MRKLYYIEPSYQEEPLLIVHTENIDKVIEQYYPNCTYSPAPSYLLHDNNSGLNIENVN